MSDFILNLISGLDKKASRKQINADIKQLEKLVNTLRLTATLAKGDSKRQINQIIRQMEGQLHHIRLKAKIDQRSTKADINKALNNLSFKDITVNVNLKGTDKLKLKFKKVVADAQKVVKNNPISLNIELKKEKLNNQLTTYLTKNTKIRESDILLKEADKLRNKIAGINDRDSLRNATDSFQLFRSEVSATGYQSKSTTDKLKSLVGGVTRLGSVVGVASIAVNKFHESLKTIKINDSILTEVSKTSNSTKNELEKIGDAAFDVASKYGRLSSDWLLAVQEMNRSGFYNEAGKALGELSLKAQAAGNIAAETAIKYLLATNAAYDYKGSIEKLTEVLDGQNIITNTFSVDMDQMSASTERAASVAANAGVSIEQLSAMIGTISSRTKEAGEKTGTGIRSLLVNLQNVSSSKIVDTLAKANASMTEMIDGTEKLRNPIAILKDLAKTYNALDENDPLKSEITTNIGQKWHANQLSALLSGWDTYEKMLKVYANGAGSSAIEAKKTADSLDGRLNSLQNAWDELIDGIINKDALKDSISLFEGIINISEKLIDTFDVIPLAVTGVTAAFTALNKDYGITRIFNDKGKLDIGGNFLGIDFDQIKHFKEAEKAITRWNEELSNGVTDIASFNNETVKNTAQLRDYLSTCSVDAPASLKGYKQHLQAAGISTDALRIKTVLLNSALGFGLGIVVQAAVTGIMDLANAQNKTAESAEAFSNSLGKFNDSFAEGKQKIGELAEKYEELSKGVDNAGHVTTLSKEKYSEYKDVIKQLSDIMPNLTTLFNQQGEKIGFVGGKIDDVNKKYQEYIRLQSQAFLTEGDEAGNTYQSILDDYHNKTKERADTLTGVVGSLINTLPEVLTVGLADAHDLGYYDTSSELTTQGKIEQLERFIELTNQLNRQEIGQFTTKPWEQETVDYVEDLLDTELFDVADMSGSEFNTFVQSVYTKLDSLKQEQDVAFAKVRDGFIHMLNANKEYWDLDENVQESLTSFVQSMSSDFLTDAGVDMYNQNSLQTFIGKVVESFAANKSGIKEAYKNLLSLDTDAIPVEEAEIKIHDYCLQIAKAFGKDEASVHPIMDMFGVDNTETERLLANVKGKLQPQFADKAGQLTPEQLKVAAEDLAVPKGVKLSWDELIHKVKEYQTKVNVKKENPLKSFSKAWENLGKGDNDAAKAAGEAKEKLLELAEAGKLTVKAFEKSDIAESFLKETGLSAEEATAKINELISSADQLASMKSGISSIATILGEKKENLSSKKTRTKGIGIDTLAGMPEDIKEQTKEYEHFAEVLGDGKSSMNECRSAANKLATAYVNSNNFLSNLTAEKEDYYISVLKEMNIENAAEVVTAALNRQKVNARIATFDLKTATKQEISTLGVYVKSLDDSSKALAYYTLQQQIANHNALSTSSSVENLKNLAKQCGITGEAISLMTSLATDMKTIEYYTTGMGKNDEHAGDIISNANVEVKGNKKRLNKIIKNGVKIDPTPKITPQMPSGPKKSKSQSDKPTKTIQTIDWIARKLTTLNTRLETVKKNFDAIFTRKKVNTTADLIKQQNKNLDDQIKLQKQLEKANNKAARKYDKLAGKIGLGKKYRNLVNNGGYSIEDFVTTSSSSSKKSKGKGKKKVSQSTYDKIQKYIDYRDKASSARQSALQAKVEQENARIQKLQNEQSRYDTLASEASSRQEYGSPKKRKEAAKDEWTWQKKSYDVQIKQAKLQKDTAKVKQLQAEMSNAETANKVKQLEIDKDVYDTRLATYQAQQATAKLKDANHYVDNQIKDTKESYKLQIKIAKAQGNTALASQLEAEAQKANVDLLQQKVDNAKAYYNAELGLLDNKGQQIQNKMDLIDARGDILSTDYYDKLSDIEKQRQATLNEELQDLEGKLSGFSEGTQEWYDLNNSIQETKNSIAQSQKQIYDNTTASRELRDKIYDLIRAIPQNLADEYSFLGELVRGENVSSDTGDFTQAGLAKLYARYMGFSALNSNIKTDRDRLHEIESIYDDYLLGKTNKEDTMSKAGKYDYNSIEDLRQGIQDVRKQLQEDINGSKAHLDSIRDIVKEKMEAMLDFVSDAIEAHKELLNQEKALYDYQRQMLEKTKTISSIEKQMAALKGDGSEEGRARLAKLQVQLDEANQDLKDTEHNKYISDQQDMLDQMLKEYSDLMEQLQKDENYLINAGFNKVNTNLNEMQEILKKIANAWSYPQSNTYKDSENAVKKDVEDGGVPDYNPDNIVTKPGQTEENKVTATLDKTSKDYLDKLNGNSSNDNNGGNSNSSNGGAWDGFLNQSKPSNDPDADEHHSQRADTVDTGRASTGAFGPGATVADEKRYAEQARLAGAVPKDKIQAVSDAINKMNQPDKLNAARSFIGANAKKAKKKRSELSYVNQKIYDATDGKVLSTENLKKLAKNTLKIEYDNAGKDGNLAKKLKEIKYSGFRTGGIAELMPKGEDGLAWVRNGEGFVKPEDVEHIKKLLEVIPNIEHYAHAYDNVSKVSNVNNQASYGDVNFNFELNEVTDPRSIVKAIQNDKGLRNTIEAAAWDRVMGKGDLAIHRFR